MYRADVEEQKVYLEHFGVMAPFHFSLDSSPIPQEKHPFSLPLSQRRLPEEEETKASKEKKSSIGLYDVATPVGTSGNCVDRSLAAKLTNWWQLASVPGWKFARLNIKCYSADSGKECTKAKISLKFDGAKTLKAVSVIKNNTLDPTYVMPRDDVWIRVKGYGELTISFDCYKDLFSMSSKEKKVTNIPKVPQKYTDNLTSWMKKLELDTWKNSRTGRRSNIYESALMRGVTIVD